MAAALIGTKLVSGPHCVLCHPSRATMGAVYTQAVLKQLNTRYGCPEAGQTLKRRPHYLIAHDVLLCPPEKIKATQRSRSEHSLSRRYVLYYTHRINNLTYVGDPRWHLRIIQMASKATYQSNRR